MLPEFDFNNKKIWIAGETGMVGKALWQRLKNEHCEILSAPHSVLDLTDKDATYDWLKHHQPNAVIVAAGKVGGIGANASDPEAFLNINLQIAENVIHGSFEADVEKLLYLGSSCIYPKFAEQPIKEEALLTGELEKTNEAYALAKISGLKLCQYYRTQHQCDYIAAMPTNLYGPHDHYDEEKSHVIPALILKIHNAQKNNDPSVTLWGTGTPLREFLHVDDLAEALVIMLKKYSGDIALNIGSGEELSIEALAVKIADVVGYKGEIRFDPKKPDGTPRKLLDSGRACALGWEPKTALGKGLEAVYQDFLKQIYPN